MNLRSATLRCLLSLVLLGAMCAAPSFAGGYRNFRVAVYIPVGVVERMQDPQWLESSWNTISHQLKVDKVYIESYRSRNTADEQLLERVKQFFLDHGVQVAGGMALADNDSNQFRSFCYTDPQQRAYVKAAAELTARHFDEIILDDFFFNMTMEDSDIAAKGARSWPQFRLELMDEVSRDLVVQPIKAVNPKARVIIKFPNWYEHFQGLGYDLDQQPKIFDGIYTGTETRDPVITDQHLQAYESYQVVRYYDNIKPGGNGGGWVDTFSLRYIDRYAEQLWDTLFARPPELTLFNWDALLEPIQPGERKAWQQLPTSYSEAGLRASFHSAPGLPQPTVARAAGYAIEQVDRFAGQLGQPVGIAGYKPYQSSGEDFLHNYLGMIGIPIELQPQFPEGARTVLLTESAKADPEIVGKIRKQLRSGGTVVITSGLLHALQGKGIEELTQAEYTDRKALVSAYLGGFGAGNGTPLGGGRDAAVLIPQVRFLTNDQWPVVRGLARGNGFPLLLMGHYSKGTLFVLTIPDNFDDLYALPQATLSAIKDYILGDFPVHLDAPAQVSLFAYDNGSFIVESFRDQATAVNVDLRAAQLQNLVTGQRLSGTALPPRHGHAADGWQRFSITLQPHSYVVLARPE